MNILVTKRIGSEATGIIKNLGWTYDVVETLRISLVDVGAIQPSDAWVISSRNSFPAIEKVAADAPVNIFCIGNWIKRKLQAKEVKARIETFGDINSLLQRIREIKFQRITYFCGDHQRIDLTRSLSGISEVIKVITHKSDKAYPLLNKRYDAVMVFSPRSVESLLKNNTFAIETVFGCIGPTTESYLHSLGITNTFCASSPDREILTKEFCNHLAK